MQLEGEITRITFHNPENGFTIATLKHGLESTTVVGKFFSAACGQLVKLNGEFVQNKTFGLQFQFSSFESVLPNTTLGLQKFLGSGLIRGVGMITAANIVKHFGTDTLEIMEFHPERLAEIRGISLKKALSAGESFKDYRHVQKVISFLSEYGISVNLALKIFDIYQNSTIQKIQENPYRLIENVRGIGFATADRIAAKFGIAKNSTFRIRAGFVHTLLSACEKNGHTFLPKTELVDETAKLLQLGKDDKQFDGVLLTLALEHIIALQKINGQEIVSPSALFKHEKALADKLAMMNFCAEVNQHDLVSSIKHFEQINNINLHIEQVHAIQTAIQNGLSVITGGPGTGKTTIIKCILEILSEHGYSVLCLAPTGRAAKRMADATHHPASTIHRALAMDFENNRFYYDDTNPLPATAVIIDEFSMVDASLGYYLFRALRPDCKVIIVGDKDQLPSVGSGNVLADIIASGVIKCASLTQIFRQDEGSLIITNAHLINQGQMPILDNQSKDFFFDTKQTQEEIQSAIISMVTKRLPQFLNVPTQNIQVLAPMKSGTCGVSALNQTLQNAINPKLSSKPEVLFGNTIFRLGDKVMQTKNNYNMEFVQYSENNCQTEGRGIFNGDMGFITRIESNSGEVEVTFEGEKVCTFLRTDLGQLSLAYAITIHKSQGSEFDAVVIPSISGPSIIFNRNLIYTAITRAKKLVVLVGQKRNLAQMIRNKFILKRHTLLEHFLKKSAPKATALFSSNH